MSEATNSKRAAPWKGRLALALLKGCARLSLTQAIRLGRGLGLLMWLFARQSRAVVQCNLALCFPEKSARERRALAREAMQGVGATFTEAGALWLWPKHKLDAIRCEVVGGELLEAALVSGRGVLIALPHLGGWEFFNRFLLERTPRFMAMYRPAKIPALDKLMRQARERMGAALVPASAAGVKALMKHLSQGGVSVVLPDQEPADRASGVFAPFFGLPALTMTLYSRLLGKTGALSLLAFVERLADGAGYRVHIHAAPAGIDAACPLTAATALNAGVESCVRALPSQYQWNYKRFNARPDDEAITRLYAQFQTDPQATLALMDGARLPTR